MSSIEVKIRKLDAELGRYKDQMSKMRNGPGKVRVSFDTSFQPCRYLALLRLFSTRWVRRRSKERGSILLFDRLPALPFSSSYLHIVLTQSVISLGSRSKARHRRPQTKETVRYISGITRLSYSQLIHPLHATHTSPLLSTPPNVPSIR